MSETETKIEPHGEPEIDPTAESNTEHQSSNHRKRKTLPILGVGALALSMTLPALLGTPASGEDGAPTVRYNNDGSVYCVETGPNQRMTPIDDNGKALGPFCFNNSDLTVSEPSFKRIADENPNLTEEDLRKIEDTSVLSPGSTMRKGTFANKPLTGNEKIDGHSSETSRETIEINNHGTQWLTAYSAGEGVGSFFNIPTLSYPSNNPHSNWVEVNSTDGRVANNPDNAKVMTGPVAIPDWYLKTHLDKGDRSVYVYDPATGIARSMFYFQKKADAQTYSTVSRIGVDGEKTAAPDLHKVNYDLSSVKVTDTDGKLTTTDEVTSPAPTSDNLDSKNQERMDIPRNARFHLGEGAPAGVTIDERTGKVTIPAGTEVNSKTKSVDIPVEVDFPEVWNFSSGGYTMGQKDFLGLGDAYYYLNLRSGTSSVVGIQNELTQIGVDELLKGEIKHKISMTWDNYQALSSAPAKMADGSVNSKNNDANNRFGTTHADGTVDYPYAPHAGQQFTFPKDFDVDKWVDQNRPGDDVMRMVMKAIQKYGGIITDRNIAINSFNFESPLSYAPYAREGKNVYKENPKLKSLMDQFYPYSFPYWNMEWIEKDYLGDPNDTSVKNIQKPVIDYREEGREIYEPDSIDMTVYQGQEAMFSQPISYVQASPDITYHVGWYAPGQGEVQVGNGKFTQSQVGKRVIPNKDFVGTLEANIKVDWFRKTEAGDEEAQKNYFDNYNGHFEFRPVLNHRPTRASGEIDWRQKNEEVRTLPIKVHVVDRNKPIAREDYTTLAKDSDTTVDALANDDASFSLKGKVTGLTLVDNDGKDVDSYSDDYGTYTIVDNKIHIEGKGKTGYSPKIKYRAITDTGEKSDVGTVQALFADKMEDVVEPAPEPTTDPTAEPTSEPTSEPSAEPTENPTENPTQEPTATSEPTSTPTATSVPTAEPTAEPTATEEPTQEPTQEPTAEPTTEPTATTEPTSGPTQEPTSNPSATTEPSGTTEPTSTSSNEPSHEPTQEPSPSSSTEFIAAPSASTPESTRGSSTAPNTEPSPGSPDNSAKSGDPSVKATEPGGTKVDTGNQAEISLKTRFIAISAVVFIGAAAGLAVALSKRKKNN